MSAAQGFGPVLIANRGEIAIRIARTCRRLGFPTVAIYSDADRFAEHLNHCDQAFFVGSAAPKESYLNIERILAVARRAGAKFVHPGYGFLSERPEFASACEKAGLVFVGPTAKSMEQMGDKIRARETVDGLRISRVPGSAGVVKSASEAKRIAATIGYPVLLKAAAGGGGKGMRRVDRETEIDSAFEGATREAQGAFGNGSLYVEKLILEPHHVEIQVFGDGRGNAIHLGERECSVQRRHQKVLEETPSPILDRFSKTREAMFEAATRIAKHVKYAGAGTMEFIVDGSGNFYFLEMNTRLQVEHPVTEWVTGVDLVAWQLFLAASKFELPASPERRGHAVEARVYAEDPIRFLPAPGPLGSIDLPQGAFVRTDSAFTGPGEVSVYYDPMIAKISVWAPTREEAIERMRVALDEARVAPPKKLDGTPIGSLRTNLPFLRRLIKNADVKSGNTTTDLIARNPALTTPATAAALPLEAALGVSIFELIHARSDEPASSAVPRALWMDTARREGLRS